MRLEPVEITIPMQRDEVDRAAVTRLHERNQPVPAPRRTRDTGRTQLDPVRGERLDRRLPRGNRALGGHVAAAPVGDHVWLVEGDDVLDLGHGVADVGDEGVGVVAPEHGNEFEGGSGSDDGWGCGRAVAVVPGHGIFGTDEDGVVTGVDAGGDVDQATFRGGGLGVGAAGGGDGDREEEGEGMHCGGCGVDSGMGNRKRREVGGGGIYSDRRGTERRAALMCGYFGNSSGCNPISNSNLTRLDTECGQNA